MLIALNCCIIAIAFYFVAFKNEFRRGFKGINYLGVLLIAVLLFDLSLTSFSSLLDLRLGMVLLRILVGLSLLFFGLANLKRLSAVFISIGVITNSVVVIANGGVMPVSHEMLKKYFYQSSLSSGYILIDCNTKLAFLGDVIYFPYAGGIFSIGDLLFLTGMLFLIVEYRRLQKSRMA